MREVGSEFWSVPQTPACTPLLDGWVGNIQYYLSGRTALAAIIRDILAERPCKTACLPSYCCHTMIEPFVRHGLQVDFYPVAFENGCLRAKDCPKADIVLVLNYFGFSMQLPATPAGAVVIQDLTHALLSDAAPLPNADYLFASFRKWGAIAGAAAACKRSGRFSEAPTAENEPYIRLRKEAYRLKTAYIHDGSGDKQTFLELFSRAEELLETDYADYSADEQALAAAGSLRNDMNKRRQNAAVLYEGLQRLPGVKPLFSQLHKGDTPLFVPILVKSDLRDSLKQHLIDNRVYCPCHWPLSALHRIRERERELYDTELSLICDQRYTASDMERILALIRGYEEAYA